MRSERALTLALTEMYVQDVSTRKVIYGLQVSNTVTRTGLSPVCSR
jgi:transposase-like protein